MCDFVFSHHPVQDQQAVSVLRRGGAVRDGKRVMAAETLALGKVREAFLTLALGLSRFSHIVT